MRRGFGDKGPAQAQVAFTFDDAARQRAGYAIAGVSGPILATIRTPIPVENVDTQIDLDLTRTNFDNPLPGLVKPAGKPAKSSFTLTRHGEAMSLEQFSVRRGTDASAGRHRIRQRWRIPRGPSRAGAALARRRHARRRAA